MKPKTIVLAGSGHGHLEVIKALTKKELKDNNFLLISPNHNTYYSGLIPRFITGEINENYLSINSAKLAEAKGFKFIQDEVQSIDKLNKILVLKSGNKIQYDLLSLNFGGTPTIIPTDSESKTIYLRPLDRFFLKWKEIQNNFNHILKPKIVVIGGGAAAVEVASALQIRLTQKHENNVEVHLISKGTRLCENYSEKISEKIKQSLLKNGIKIHLNEEIKHIQQKAISLVHGGALEYDYVFIATPTKTSKIILNKADSKLRIADNIFAVGDCTEMNNYPKLPKSGVIAVHQGRHLVKSIRKVLQNLEPTEFKLKNKHLNILVTGKNSARLVWGNLSFEGQWPLIIKNWIDRKYILSFL